MSEVPAGSEHQHLSTAVRMETTTTIHPIVYKKILLKGKYIFCATLTTPPPPPLSLPPSHHLFYNYSFFVILPSFVVS